MWMERLACRINSFDRFQWFDSSDVRGVNPSAKAIDIDDGVAKSDIFFAMLAFD